MSGLRRWWHVRVLGHAMFTVLSAVPGAFYNFAAGQHTCSCGATWDS